MLVSVWPTLFMEEAHGMHQLMQDSITKYKTSPLHYMYLLPIAYLILTSRVAYIYAGVILQVVLYSSMLGKPLGWLLYQQRCYMQFFHVLQC